LIINAPTPNRGDNVTKPARSRYVAVPFLVVFFQYLAQ
jgi:hypothetical protein